ncbi:MAG: DNA-binding protein, partial [Prevotella sp.]|nr:DNA-binding protein [Prevotella sp.]
MTNLMKLVSEGSANIKLEITYEDLRNFSDELIRRAVEEVGATVRAGNEERLLSREEVKDLCGVCDATLWHWNKRNYLKAIKLGSKVR